MLIGTGVQVAGSIISGKKQANAANKASGAQSRANNKAFEAITRGYEDARGAMAPYARVGGEANDLMGRLMTPGVPYNAPRPGPSPWDQPPGGPAPGVMGAGRQAMGEPPPGQMRTMFQRGAPPPPQMLPQQGPPPPPEMMGGGGHYQPYQRTQAPMRSMYQG